ncbi:McrBC 5-methylcytosine restriction system component [Streptococcus pneumoniae]|nr:McrBC 5-methylcytosine restriction system component [Streptococcus pneumoniae]
MGNLAGYGALLKKWSIQIPQKSSSYSAFCKMMENSDYSAFCKMMENSEENFKAIIDEEVGRK